jgi:hypothetical protein
MKSRSRAFRTVKALALSGLVAGAAIAPVTSGSARSDSGSPGLTFNGNSQVTRMAPGGWNEPSGIAGSDGELYIASQNPNNGPMAMNTNPDTLVSQSSDGGQTWKDNTAYFNYLSGRAEGQTGDVTMAADRDKTVFLGHLTGSLQTDIDYTRDDGKTWATASDVAPGLPSPGAASSSPFLVDRPWIAVYAPSTNYKDDIVYLEYHDFVTSDVYIVTCTMTSGTLSCGSPVTVSNPATSCNSIPGGVAVSPPGSAHPGRVYAVWETADPITNATSGCNYTQLAPFYQLYVAWSDAPTQSGWNNVPVYIAPTGSGETCPGTSPAQGVSTNTCADESELFTPIAVDAAGNVYVAFVDYIDTLNKHYDLYLERSLDGGKTWDGKSDGSGTPLQVSDSPGTHYTPQIVAGAAGRVAISYFDTSYSTTPYTSGASCPHGAPPETSCQGKNQPEPPSTQWIFDVAESVDANAAVPHFAQVQASDAGVVVHYGDMCNLGIYCDGSSTGNRSMYENTTVFPEPDGRLVAAWTDQRLDTTGAKDAAQSNAQSLQVAHDEIFATTEKSGPPLFGSLLAPKPPAASHCAQPTGRLAGVSLGPIRLGMTRAAVRRRLGKFSTRHRRFMDFYCLYPTGIRAGYPSPRLLRSLSARERRRVEGRVVLVLTSASYYSLRGVRPGATLADAAKVLKVGKPFHIGLNYWYLAPFGHVRAVLKVRHGTVEEIGIANASLTAGRRAAFRFMKSFD